MESVQGKYNILYGKCTYTDKVLNVNIIYYMNVNIIYYMESVQGKYTDKVLNVNIIYYMESVQGKY